MSSPPALLSKRPQAGLTTALTKRGQRDQRYMVWTGPPKQVKKQIETHQFTRQNGQFLTDLSVFRCPMALLDSAKISSSSTGRRPELKWSSPDWQLTQVPISCSKLSRASWFGLSTHSHCSTCSPHCSRGPETVWRYIGNEMKHKTRSRNRLLYHLKKPAMLHGEYSIADCGSIKT